MIDPFMVLFATDTVCNFGTMVEKFSKLIESHDKATGKLKTPLEKCKF